MMNRKESGPYARPTCISQTRLMYSHMISKVHPRSRELGCSALEDYREQFVLTDNVGDLPKGKERYQYDEHHKSDQQNSLQAATAQRRYALGDRLVVKNPGQHFLQNVTTRQQ